MNEIHIVSVAGLLIAMVDFFDFGRGVNRYLKRLNKAFMAAMFSGVDPDEGSILTLDVGSIFMFVFITNLVNAFVLFVNVVISNPPDQGVLHFLAGILVFVLIAAMFSVLCSYAFMFIFGFWQSYMNYYLDFGIQTRLVKAWLILISPLALAFFPIVLFLVVLIVVNYGAVSLAVYVLSLPKKGILGSLGLLIAASLFFM